MIVYIHIRLDKNEPFYIGIGKDIKRAYISKRRNPLWNNIVNKTEYEVQILFEDVTREFACEKEMELIQLYGRFDLGTGILANMTDGGEHNKGRNPWNKGKTGVYSEETKARMSEKNFGNSYHKGKPHSEETKDKISKSKKGVPSGRKGQKVSDEEKERLRSINIGNTYRKGKPHTQETKDKIAQKLRDNKILRDQLKDQTSPES